MKTNCSSKLARGQKTIGLLFAGLFIFLSGNVMAQKNMIGIYGSGEFASGLGIRNVSGLVYERKFTKNFGIETGALLNNLKVYSDYGSFGINKRSGAYINHLYVNVPVLFKYYSNIVNIAAGPTINTKLAYFRTGDLTREIKYSNFNPPNDFGIGYQFKLSKSFNIKDKFILEPEISIGNRFEFKKPSFGIGASFKYKF